MEEFKNKNPFKTPERYFENFNGQLLDKLSEEPSVVPKNEGFKVPENYFDGLYANVRQKLPREQPKVISLGSYRKYWYAAASIAAIVLFFIGVKWNATDEIGFDDLAISDIEAYFNESDMDLNTLDIAEIVSFEDLEIDDVMTTSIGEDQILEYLDNHVDNIEELRYDTDEY
ncbi:hypothetical protein [Pareuzebyella sediminis]|uniref:hypothetical protein n=1 Tax=Pareuzebyella sediminis TaxID=2607998 RepID=UPI0011F03BF2|nr:hypothetical protein [Pareuzebyella sediminis]